MNNFNSKDRQTIFAIGIYQIIGGLIGAMFVLIALFETTEHISISLLVYLAALVFFSYSIYCGYRCIQFKRNALLHSLINQFLQIISFAVAGYAFSYSAGILCSIGLDLTNSIIFTFNINIPQFEFTFNQDIGTVKIAINFVPFVLVFMIDKMRTTQKKAQPTTQAGSHFASLVVLFFFKKKV